MTVYASLLRGINLGGTRKVPMAELREGYEGLGFEEVASYIASGNVVFRTGSDDAAGVAAGIEAMIDRRFGFDDVDVFLRTGEQLERLVADNPFLAEGADPARLHVTFVEADPADALVDVDPEPYEPDAFAAGPRAVYVHCPEGYGRSKLNNAFFEKLLDARATTRNWRTVNRLVELVSAARDGS